MRPKKSEQITGIIGRGELVRRLREREGLTWKQSNRIFEDLFADIADALLHGTSVYIPKLGKLYVVNMAVRRVRHPITKEMIEVEVGESIRFRQSANMRQKFKELKEVNEHT